MDLKDLQELIEDIEDLAVIAERQDEPTLSHEEVLAELKPLLPGG